MDVTNQNSAFDQTPFLARARGTALLTTAGITVLLFTVPTLGLTLLWNVLIPLVPALLVLAPGLWRNVCPLAVAAHFPVGKGRYAAKRCTPERTALLNLAAVAVLLLIVPLRHAFFDTHPVGTTLLLAALVLSALAVGTLLGGRNGWCAGLCPLYPVEKLYGSGNVFTFRNGRCARCSRCTAPCPDTVRAARPFTLRNRWHTLAGTLMIGGFPGFIWGWFQVPDDMAISGVSDLSVLYAAPFTGLAVTAFLYEALRHRLEETTRVQLFAAAAVASYYAFRLPNLLGFGRFHGDGMLIDLSQTLPVWTVVAAVAAETLFFFWWFLRRGSGAARPWLNRPENGIV